MARDDATASIRVRVDKEESKIERVTEVGVGWGCVASWESAWVSGTMDGKDEAIEGTFSHF